MSDEYETDNEDDIKHCVTGGVFPAKREKPPRDGGPRGEMARVLVEGGPGITEPMCFGPTFGGSGRLTTQPLREGETLIALGAGGFRSVGTEMAGHARILARMSGASDTAPLRCWKDEHGVIYPKIQDPLPSPDDIKRGIFVDNITVLAYPDTSGNTHDAPRHILYGLFKAFNNGKRIEDRDSALWVKMSPIGQAKVDQGRVYKVMMANVDLRVVALIVEVIGVVRWMQKRDRKAFRGSRRAESIHNIATMVCEKFPDAVLALGCEDRIPEAVAYAVRGRVEIQDIDLTHDYRGTLNADKAAANIDALVGVDATHKCGVNCVRSEWLDVRSKFVRRPGGGLTITSSANETVVDSDDEQLRAPQVPACNERSPREVELEVRTKAYNKVIQTLQSGAVRKNIDCNDIKVLHPSTPGLKESFSEFQGEGVTR